MQQQGDYFTLIGRDTIFEAVKVFTVCDIPSVTGYTLDRKHQTTARVADVIAIFEVSDWTLDETCALIADFDADLAAAFREQVFQRRSLATAFARGFTETNEHTERVTEIVMRVARMDQISRRLAFDLAVMEEREAVQ